MKDTPEITKSNILSSAKAEFLEKGFMGASLRTIAANAHVTTGALYRHFRDKDALFCALVDEAVQKTVDILYKAGKESHENILDPFGKEHQQTEDMLAYTFSQYLLENMDIFMLLLTKSGGSTHENFFKDMSDLYTKLCLELVHWLQATNKINKQIDDVSVHCIASSFIFSFAEIILHKIPAAEVSQFLDNIKRFFRFGWLHLFEICHDTE